MEEENFSLESLTGSILKKKISQLAAKPFEGTSLQRRLMSRIKISFIKLFKGIIIGAIFGFPLVCFGPLIVATHSLIYRKTSKRPASLSVLIFAMIFSVFLSCFNAFSL
jgi:hypothetical protein